VLANVIVLGMCFAPVVQSFLTFRAEEKRLEADIEKVQMRNVLKLDADMGLLARARRLGLLVSTTVAAPSDMKMRHMKALQRELADRIEEILKHEPDVDGDPAVSDNTESVNTLQPQTRGVKLSETESTKEHDTDSVGDGDSGQGKGAGGGAGGGEGGGAEIPLLLSLDAIDAKGEREVKKGPPESQHIVRKHPSGLPGSNVPTLPTRGEEEETVPDGWEKVPSKSRPGQFAYVNAMTGVRVATLAQISEAEDKTPARTDDAHREPVFKSSFISNVLGELDEVVLKWHHEKRERFEERLYCLEVADQLRAEDVFGEKKGFKKAEASNKLYRARIDAAAAAVEVALAEVIVGMLDETDLIKTCDAQIKEATGTLASVYDTVLKLILHMEPAGFEHYEVELAGLKVACGKGEIVQQKKKNCSRMGTLVEMAINAKIRTDVAIKGLQGKLVAEVDIPEKLEPLGRVIERMLMTSATDFEHCCDLVRYQFTVHNMRSAASVCAEFHKNSNIVVVGVVDNFAALTGPDCWKSCRIYFHHALDVGKFICEAEIVHSKLANIRGGGVNDHTSSFTERDTEADGKPTMSLRSLNSSGRSWRSKTARDSLEPLHTKLRSASEVLQRFGLTQEGRAAKIAGLISEDKESLRKFVDLGVSEEEMRNAGAELDALVHYYGHSAVLAAGRKRKMSRLSSEHMHDDHEDAPHDTPGTGTAGAKVTPAWGSVGDEPARGVKFSAGQLKPGDVSFRGGSSTGGP